METVIAKNIVEFASRGLDSALSGIDKLAAKARSAATIIATIGGAAVGTFAAFGAMAAQGTAEGERLSQAWDLFARSAGDLAAPAVRMLSQALIEAARFIQSVNAAIRDAAGGTSFFAQGMDLVIKAFENLRPVAETTAQVLITAWDYITGAITQTWDVATQFGSDLVQTFKNGADAIISVMKPAFDFIIQGFALVWDTIGEGFKGLFDQINALGVMPPIEFEPLKSKNIPKLFEDAVGAGQAAWEAFMKDMEGRQPPKWLGDMLSGLDGALRRIRAAGAADTGFNRKLDVGFESGQGTWERLQKSFASQPDSMTPYQQAQLNTSKAIAENTQKIAASTAKIGDYIPPMR